MKKIIIIPILLLCATAFSQFPQTRILTNNQTRAVFDGGAEVKLGLINGVYTDTTAANAGYIDFYNGAQIWTRSDRNFWLRDSVLNTWIRMAKYTETFLRFGVTGEDRIASQNRTFSGLNHTYSFRFDSLDTWDVARNGTQRIFVNSIATGLYSPTGFNFLQVYDDSIAIRQVSGNYSIYNVPQRFDTAANKVMTWNATTLKWGWDYWHGGGAGGGETQQQTFDLEAGNAVLNKNNTFTMRHNTTFKFSAKTNGYWEFTEDSADTRMIRMSTQPEANPLRIEAKNNEVAGIPTPQIAIYNPETSNAKAQCMISFIGDGGALPDTAIGWIGMTTNTYNVGGGIRRNTTYVENDSNGVALLANSATIGSIRDYVGPFDQNTSLRGEVEVDTTNIYNKVFQQYSGSVLGSLMYRYSNESSSGGADYYFNDNANNGLNLRKVTNSGNATLSFTPLNFFSTSTTNVGQFLSTNSNYANAAVNLPASAIGLLSNGAGGLSFIAGVSATDIKFTAGGYSSSNQIATMKFTTGLKMDRRFSLKQGADVASVSGTITVGSDGSTFELTGTNSVDRISSTDHINGSEITLVFTSTATLVDGTANSGSDIGMELEGNANFVGSADDIVTLVLCEIGGVQRWRMKSKSVN